MLQNVSLECRSPTLPLNHSPRVLAGDDDAFTMSAVQSGDRRAKRGVSQQSSETVDGASRHVLHLLRRAKGRVDGIRTVWKARLDALYWLLDDLDKSLKEKGDGILQSHPNHACSFWEYLEAILRAVDRILATLALYLHKRKGQAAAQTIHLLAAADCANAAFDSAAKSLRHVLDAYQVAVDYSTLVSHNWERYAEDDKLAFVQRLERLATTKSSSGEGEEGKEEDEEEEEEGAVKTFRAFMEGVLEKNKGKDVAPGEVLEGVREELVRTSKALLVAQFSNPANHSILPKDLELVGGGFAKYLVSPQKKVKVELSVETTELMLWRDSPLDDLQQLALLKQGEQRRGYAPTLARILGTCAFKEAVHIVTESYHTTLSALLHGVCNDSFTGPASDPIDTRRKPLTEEEILAIFYGLCSGLAFLHSRLHVYGCLRPQDVLLGGDNRSMVKLRNFEAARIGREKESDEYGMFTFPYKAPETLGLDSEELLADCQVCIEAMDVYAAGIILWEASQRGAFPYLMCMESDAEIMQAIVKKDLRPKFSEDFAVAPSIEEFVRRCWRKQPGSRPTASELKREMEQAYDLDHSRAVQTVASVLQTSLSVGAAKGLPEAQIDAKTSVSMGAVVERLKLFAADDAGFAAHGLSSISRLLRSEDQVKPFLVHGGAEVVIEAARANLKNPPAALQLCEVVQLRPAVFANAKTRVVELLLILLEEHSVRAEVTAAVLKTLAMMSMALDGRNEERVLDPQTAAMIVSIFEHDEDIDEAVQVSLLTFLASLAHRPSASKGMSKSNSRGRAASRAGKEGPLDATYINSILYLMENNSGLYSVGCSALRHICSEKNQQKAKQMTLVNLGVIDKVLKIAAKRRKTDWVQQSSLGLLLPLARASHAPVLQRLAKLSTPQYVLKVMRAHRQDLEIIKPCLELLVIFARGKKVKMKLSKGSVVHEVLEVAVTTREDAKMVECCLTVLLALRIQEDVAEEKLFELLKVLPMLTKPFRQSPKILRLSLGILRSAAQAIGNDMLHEVAPKPKKQGKTKKRTVVRLSVYGKITLRLLAEGLKSGDDKTVRECGDVLKNLADSSDVNKITLLRFKLGTRLLRQSLPFAADPLLTATTCEALMSIGDFNVEMAKQDIIQCFNPGVILYALRCIHQHHGHVQIVVFCLQTIGNFVSHFPQCREEVFQHKGIRLALLLISAYSDNSFVIVEALITLRNLCATEGAASKMIQAGDLLATLDSLLAGATADEKIMLHLLELLRQISAGNRRSHITIGARRSVDQGFVGKVVTVMERFRHSISVQYAGLEVLVNLCSVSSWAREGGRFTGGRVAHVVLALLREGQEVKHVQFMALSTLENMLSHPELDPEMMQVEDINQIKPAVCATLERNISHGGISQVALGSLCNLIHHIGTERVCDREMMDLVLRAMQRCEKKVKSGPIVAENGCNILRAVLGSGDATLKLTLLRDGVVEDIGRVMRRYARDARIQRYATLALANLSTSFSDGYWSKSEERGLVREQFKDEKVPELMENATRICQHDDDVQRAAPAIVQFCNESKSWFGFSSSG